MWEQSHSLSLFCPDTHKIHTSKMKQVYNKKKNWATATVASRDWTPTGLQVNIEGPATVLCIANGHIEYTGADQGNPWVGLSFFCDDTHPPVSGNADLGFNSFHTYAANCRIWAPMSFTQVLQVPAGTHLVGLLGKTSGGNFQINGGAIQIVVL